MLNTDLLNSDNIYDAESGHFFSAAHQKLAELVNLYNPELFVVWIPGPERVKNGPKPYGIAQMKPGQEPYVFMLMSEIEMNDPTRIMQMIIASDGGKGADATKFLSAEADARELIKQKNILAEREEMHDRAKSAFRTPLHTYRLGGGKVIRS
jgi:hypothetical protein